MSSPDGPSPADALRWLGTRRVTLGVVALLLAVFALELAVWWRFGARSWEALFLAPREPTLGWLLAPFAHRGLPHLVTTLVVIVVYGGLIEEFLSGETYLAFYVLASYASTGAQILAYASGAPGRGTLGASGAALALVALFVTVTLARLREADDPTTVEVVFAGTGLVVLGLVVANDFVAGVDLASGTAPLGHLGGTVVGAGYGLVRTQSRSGRSPSVDP